VEEVSAQLLSELISGIYECALDSACWPEMLGKVRELMGFSNAAFSLHLRPSGAMLMNITSGIEKIWLERLAGYEEDVAAQWGELAAVAGPSLDEPVVLSRWNPEGVTERNRYAREWGMPQGLIDTLGLFVVNESAVTGAIALGRHVSAGPIGDRELRLGRLLLPHLRRAVAISRILDLQSVKASMLEESVDALSVGVFFVSRHGHVAHMNPAARRQVNGGRMLRIVSGCLVATDPAARIALDQAILEAAAEKPDTGLTRRTAPAIALPDGHGAGSIATPLSLERAMARSATPHAATVAVFVQDPAQVPALPGQAFARLYALTQAELRVVLAVAQGLGALEAARMLGVGERTVRTHLQSVFSKTETTRQTELLALLHAATPPTLSS
jgi:DNA-binding CsgD family transcriptional regulator